MRSKTFYYLSIFTAVALVVSCFLPWTFYPYINTTFNGFNVKPFATGNYYGRAGYPITILTSIFFLLIFVPKLWAKRVNIFIAALLFAYCIRTYIIFTSGLVEGDVEKRIGIFCIVIFSAALLLASVFPYMPAKKEPISK